MLTPGTSHLQTDILSLAQDWRSTGQALALATVVYTWGSSPRPIGSHLLVRETGEFAGSVSGGCIEGEVIRAAQQVMADGQPRLLEFGVSNEQAWEVGLACGGKIGVHIHSLAGADWLESLQAVRTARRPIALLTRLTDDFQCRWEAGHCSGEWQPESSVALELEERMSTRQPGILTADETLFVNVYTPATRLLIVGAVHIAQALIPMAMLAGFAVTLIDPRRSFASPERFPGVILRNDWPDEALEALQPDAMTAVVTLSHDPKLDDPALITALNSPVFYIGALGSKRSHAQRLERLREEGFADADLQRIHAPIGLDLGGRLPAEIAVSVLAQLVQTRYRAGR